MRALLCWLLLFAGAFAAETLTLQLPKRDLPLRRGGTILLDAELTNKSASILEGRLEVTMLKGGRRTATHLGPELVVPPGKMKTQMLLPPALDPAYGEGVAARIAFAMKDHSIPLGDRALGNFSMGGSDFILAIARSGRRVTGIDSDRERSARLETLRSNLETQAWFSTASLSVDVEDLPTQNAGWCAYDVVLLDSASFGGLTQRQLDSLATWIEAGGSALIFAEGPVRERQLNFLRRIASQSGGVEVDDQQHVVSAEYLRLSAGMGRVLLVPSPPGGKPALEHGAWKSAIAWLWKVRAEWLPNIREHGTWPIIRPGQHEDSWRREINVSLERWARRVALDVDRRGVERPRPLPIGWVALLLSALLVLVGPVDWHVLGWLRRRRWTWGLFPALCVGFAWGAWKMATQYLGPKTRATMVRVTDVGENQQTFREVVIRLRVPSTDEEWVTETAEGLCAAMRPGGTQDEMGVFEAYGELPETRAEWPSPSRMVLRQNLRQWTPNWQQAVTIGGKAVEGPDWGALVKMWVEHPVVAPNFEGIPHDYSIYFVPASGAREDSSAYNIAADSPVDSSLATQLGTNTRPLPDILEAASPGVVAGDALGAAPRGPLMIIAWRQTAEGLHVLRRHVTAREVEAAR